jgi:hypothetical protein
MGMLYITMILLGHYKNFTYKIFSYLNYIEMKEGMIQLLTVTEKAWRAE